MGQMFFLPASKQLSKIPPSLEAPKDTFREEGRKGRRVRGSSPHGKKKAGGWRGAGGKRRKGERREERGAKRTPPFGAPPGARLARPAPLL